MHLFENPKDKKLVFAIQEKKVLEKPTVSFRLS
jgi:hypothetical protein